MKKAIPYIVLGLLAVGLVVLVVLQPRKRKMDERITLASADKIPYGTAAARALLPGLFPDATLLYNTKEPVNWTLQDSADGHMAVVLVADFFNADDYELQLISSFVRRGNNVFIIAKNFSYPAENYYHIDTRHATRVRANTYADSLRVQLQAPFFSDTSMYVYPGTQYQSIFLSYDTARTLVLGRNEDRYADFIAMKIGDGHVFIHTAPLAFSNYFILHKNNIHYFRQVFSLIPSSTRQILWNEYYLYKPADQSSRNERSIFHVLMRYKAFSWGLITGILALALMLLLGSRRRQRKIPPYQKPKNDSLDFVKTLGRLYYDRHDHHNLARKMSAYFLEHIRAVYKLPTHTLDEPFVQLLSYKSGYPQDKLESIVDFIHYQEREPVVTEAQLGDFYRKLESFYQNT